MSELPVMERQACFQFRANFSPCTIMQLMRYDLTELSEQLTVAINRAPNFFIGSPLVIDLETLEHETQIDFQKLKQIILENNMVPVGVRGGSPEQHTQAVTAGIPVVAIGKSKGSSLNETKKSTAKPPAKIITTPIRSGMQVYAREADLIVIAPVSPGAELLSEGNIHIYGPLRGRALAGVQGNIHARIFCSSLEAELVAIAGYYLVKEDLQNLPKYDSMVQIYLENEQVKIAAI